MSKFPWPFDLGLKKRSPTSDPKTMVRKIKLYIVSMFAFAPLWSAQADLSMPISCLPEATSLQTFETWHSAQPLKRTYELKTQKFDRIKDSGVLVSVFHNLEKKSLELSFFFSQSDILSLPFNVYAVMVTTSKGQVVWNDFTSSCMDPGIGFYPGQEVSLEPIPLDLDEGESYRLMVWGRK